jgi:hypothetical protein
LVSTISIFKLVYKNYIQDAELKTILHTILFFKVDELNIDEILIQIIHDDLLSGGLSD